jgi:hypothetical protein
VFVTVHGPSKSPFAPRKWRAFTARGTTANATFAERKATISRPSQHLPVNGYRVFSLLRDRNSTGRHLGLASFDVSERYLSCLVDVDCHDFERRAIQLAEPSAGLVAVIERGPLQRRHGIDRRHDRANVVPIADFNRSVGIATTSRTMNPAQPMGILYRMVLRLRGRMAGVAGPRRWRQPSSSTGSRLRWTPSFRSLQLPLANGPPPT